MSTDAGSPPSATRHQPPAVSVVMPVFNGERFLDEAIDSILGQTFRDFEIIVVDDGSTDKTEDILKRRVARDQRLRVHRHTANEGLTAALNSGCRLARGALIARMDSDDISLPDRFQRQVDFLLAHPDVAAVGACVQRIDPAGARQSVHRYPTDPAVVAWSMLFFNSVAHPTMMMRREALDLSGVYTSEYPNIEDYALFFRLSQTSRIANLPEVLLLYRVWPGNASKLPTHQYHAMRVLRDGIREMGVEVTDEQAYALHGLARDTYPANPFDISQLGRLISTLHALHVQRLQRQGDDTRLVDTDAAVRLWQLSALAARRSLPIAVSLAVAALRLRPAAVGTFGAKILRRLRD